MLKNKIPWDFLKSTAIVLSISFLGSLGVKIFGGSFWASFLLFFSIQYVLFSFVATLIKNYYVQKTYQKQLDILEPLSTILECASCRTNNIMTFLPDQNERAEFVCSSCERKNVVNIQFLVAQITEPVLTTSATGVPLLPQLPENE